MKVFGIDPGTARMGWGVVNKNTTAPEFVDCGCVETKKTEKAEQRLLQQYDSLKKLVAKHNPDILAVEELYFSQNVKTALAVGEARGVVLLLAGQEKIPVHEYNPLQIKQALTGYGKATKKQIQEMVLRELSLEEVPEPDDAADGLAVALTHCYTKNYAR